MNKKSLSLLAAFLLILTNLFAQQLPNSGFENWESDDITSGKGAVKPVSWHISNLYKNVGIVVQGVLGTSSDNGRTGKCVSLKSVEIGALGITEASPAWVTLGMPWSYLEGTKTSTATAGTTGGISFTYQPDTISVWIKRTYSTKENAHIIFYSWRGTAKGTSYPNKGGNCTSTSRTDEECDIRQATDGNACVTSQYATQVAEAMWRNNNQFPNWTEIKVPIKYYTDEKPEKCNVIISASNYPNFKSSNVHAGAELLADDVKLIYSSRAHILYLNNRAMNGFNSETFEYEYELGQNATEVPQITLARSGRNLAASEYSVNYGGIDEYTTITVNAQDGSSTTTYRIKFITKKSTNAVPQSILLDGTPLNNFNGYSYNYNVALPYGTTQYPNITVEKAESTQTYSVTYSDNFPGTATVVVTAQDGTTTKTYTINFTLAALTDNTLTGIYVDGEMINGFVGTTNNYTINLPTGTTTAPTITYTTAYPDGQDIVLTNGGLENGVTITVTPKGTNLTRTYKIKYNITASTNSSLRAIYLDGVLLDGFAASTTSYTVSLPIGTEQTPLISYDLGDNYQTVTIENGGLNGVTKIIVTAQAGNSTIYRITFKTEKSSNCSLQAIYVDDTLIDGFDADKTDYEVILPLGQTTLPTITYTAGDDYQTITYTAGTATIASRIVVKAQDGTIKTYTISFVIRQSSNCALSAIFINGELIENYDKDILDYTITLPAGTTELPAITYTLGDEYQTVRINGSSVNGVTKITVKAQDGTTRIYNLTFAVLTSSDASLNAIYIDGEAIENFDKEALEYEVILPSGTTVLPVITWELSDNSASAVLTKGGLDGISTITVRAQDGTQKVYSILLSVMKSENAFLKMIYIDGEEIADFEPATLSYSYTLADGRTRGVTITVEKEQGQEVIILTPALNGKASIIVTPESGAANIYTIDIDFAKSSDYTLSAIYLDNVLIADFEPTKFEYNITLAHNATTPAVSYTLNDSEAKAVDNQANNEVHIYTTAQNGASGEYVITFEKQLTNIATLDAIYNDDILVPSFDKDIYQYSVTSLGSIRYTLTDPTATATMSNQGKSVRINVVSQDKSQNRSYVLTLIETKSSDATLSQIKINDEILPLNLFVNDTATYNLSNDATRPTVTYLKNEAHQNIFIADAGKGGCDILVMAQDSTTLKRYVIKYNIAPSSQVGLKGLKVQNVGAIELQSGESQYNITLPFGTTITPSLAAIPTSNDQTIEINYGPVNGATTVRLTSQDGENEALYTINFEVEKSGVSTLEAIYYDGILVPNFDSETTDYVVELPFGTTQAPLLTFDYGVESNNSVCKNQKVTIYDNGLYGTNSIRVEAQNGDVTTYNITYTFAAPTQENVLQMVFFDGEPVSGFVSNENNFNVVRHQEAAPSISVIKSYEEQNVAISSTKAEVKIDVYSPNGEKKSYHFNLTNERYLPVTLTSISVNNQAISGFNSVDTVYIVNLNEPIEQSAIFATGANYRVSEFDDAHAVINAYNDENEEVNYTLYFHYPADIIPNGDFSSWSPTVYNGGTKPTYWTAPADCAEKVSFIVAFKTGDEVKNGGGYAELNTVFHTTLNSNLPGMITLGSMSVNLKTASNTTSSVSGGIEFHNSPDTLKVDYNQIANKKIDNWRFVVSRSGSLGSKEDLFTDDYTDKNVWKTASLPLSYDNVGAMSLLNVTLNSSHSESALSCNATNQRTSTLYVDNLVAVYNSHLSSIEVNGAAISGFNPTTYTYTITLNSDVEKIDVKTYGQVRDQKHVQRWNGENSVSIDVYAEDGTSHTYTLTFNRAQSANAQLNSIFVNGAAINFFAPNTTTYNIEIPARSHAKQDISVIGANKRQTIDIEYNSNAAVINVTAENGTTRQYTINFVERAEVNTTPANIEVANHSEVVFDSAVNEYNITLNENENIPYITVEKSGEWQDVEVELSENATVKCYSSDRANYSLYRFNFTRQIAQVGLVSVSANDYEINDYSTAIEAEKEEDIELYFTLGSPADIATEVITNDGISLNINGQDYHIAINRALSNDATLSGILIDNEPLNGFMPEVTQYFVDVEAGESIEIRANTNELNLGHVSYDDDKLYFDTQAEDNTQNQTVIYFTPILSSDATLSGIYLNGKLIAQNGTDYTADNAFDANTTNYSVMLHSAQPKQEEPQIPLISVATASPFATATIETNGVNGTTYITVKAENGDEKQYELLFSTQPSAYSYLDMIYVDYEPISGFNPTTTEYDLTVDEVKVHAVTYQMGDNFQMVQVENNKTQIALVVTAQNGNSTTYQINLSAQGLSSNTAIKGIYLDNELIDGFDAQTKEYNIQLGAGITSLPEISVELNENQTATITREKKQNDDYVVIITVVAQNGDEEQYQITFSILKSTNASLSMIYINSEPLSATATTYESEQDFASDVFEYLIVLPIGVTNLPLISWDKGDEKQTTSGNLTNDSVYIISVTAQDKAYTAQYSITFRKQFSSNCQLNNILIDGEELEGFDKNIYQYDIELPSNQEVIPLVEGVAGDEWQQITETQAQNLNSSATITVLAGDKQHSATYIINFTRALSDDYTLSYILINNEPIEDFESNRFEYWVTLPLGTTQEAAVEYSLNDKRATATASGNALDGDYTITVTAENGDIAQYIIHFDIEKSHDAHLGMILINGEELTSFDEEIYEYYYTLDYNASDIPTIEWVAKEGEEQIISLTMGDELPCQAIITVTAQDGVTTHNYLINITKALSSNALLEWIKINGEVISVSAQNHTANRDFESTTFEYTVVLPWGTNEFPLIEYQGQVADYHAIEVTTSENVATIAVISQDQIYESDYIITFEIAKHDDAFLESILINNKKLKGFKSNIFEYTIEYPIGTKVSDLPTATDVTYTRKFDDQTVEIEQDGDYCVVIRVTAEDGATINVYVINFEILKSNNVYLKDILVDGHSIYGFDKYTNEYIYYLWPGAALPTVEGIKSEESQIVDVTMGQIGTLTYIFVEAEDGSEGVYTIEFRYSDENPADSPQKNDVRFTPIGGGDFMAISKKNNVIINIYDMKGIRINSLDVATIDPNDDINSTTSGGTTFHLDKRGQVYAYAFIYQGKVITSGKFAY